MRMLLHISDLHFGRTVAERVDALLQAARAIEPDLTVVSGDLTQRARRSQFEEARAFLDHLPSARLVVPGNHDIPLWRLDLRLLDPMRAYRRHISEDLYPRFDDEELFVQGASSVRRLRASEGRIRSRRYRRLGRAAAAEEPLSILVSHHPESEARASRLEALGFDVLLSGHTHRSGLVRPYSGTPCLQIQAGTAVSGRLRGEENSFNVLRWRTPELVVERWCWSEAFSSFRMDSTERFYRRDRGWEQREPGSAVGA